MKEAGAYLLTARMAGGNESRMIIWVTNAILVEKPLHRETLYYLADAITGKPLSGIKLNLFCYAKENNGDGEKIIAAAANKITDENGMAVAGFTEKQASNGNCLAIAIDNGCFAFQGFSPIWYSQDDTQPEDFARTFLSTDRPVYRPLQTVKFKCWVNQAKYDHDGPSLYSGRQFTVHVLDPQREIVLEQQLTADRYGGFQGECPLTKNAMLGEYSIEIADNSIRHGGSCSFRVEEYKKPEFEVTVDSPTEPALLGDTVTATVKAQYYFGAPVTKAKVHYKVFRSPYYNNWYPSDRWDWCYGHGYWWNASDYSWYPGWRDWGYQSSSSRWHYSMKPELVLDEEANIGTDGTLPIHIDTGTAKAMQADVDHCYAITAEVTDAVHHIVTGEGTVLVARKPFQVYAWVDREHYQVGDTVQADFAAQTLYENPVNGKGRLTLYSVNYRRDARDGSLQPVEQVVRQWVLNPDANGRAHLPLNDIPAGQYRLSYLVTDPYGRQVEGGHIFVVHDDGFTGKGYRFNNLELLTEKHEYQPGDTVHLMVNTNQEDSTVLLFIRPSEGIYPVPKVLHLHGKSITEAIAVTEKDMPDFFVEALTVSDGQLFNEMHEVIVPPENRILNVEVLPSAQVYRPGQAATVKIKVTDQQGHPYAGSLAATIYDKSVEYFTGTSWVPDIKECFWKWQHSHSIKTISNLQDFSCPLYREDETTMHDLTEVYPWIDMQGYFSRSIGEPQCLGLSAVEGIQRVPAKQAAKGMEPAVRTNFADSAFWTGALQTDANGEATIQLTMPENLTTWKIWVWAMGDGTRVGASENEVLTTKNLIVRLLAPRFFTQKDEVVLSANVHNYLASKKNITVTLELDGACLQPLDTTSNTLQAPDANGNFNVTREIALDAHSDSRVDWRVKVVQPGVATVRMKALSDEESDAVQQQFPVYLHGMMKTDSLSGVLRPEQTEAVVPFHVPEARLPWLQPAGSALFSHAGRRHSGCIALSGILSLRHQRCGARSLPARRAHTTHPAGHGAESASDPRQADQP